MDDAKLTEFMGKLVNDMGGAAMLASVIVGEELGLYRAMASRSRRTISRRRLTVSRASHASG